MRIALARMSKKRSLLTALVALVGYPVTLTAVVRMVQGRRRGRSGDMVVRSSAQAPHAPAAEALRALVV